MQKITPFLWYDGQVKEAMELYLSVFKNAEASNVMPGPDGGTMSATVKLHGYEFILFNGGPMFQFSQAVSFFIKCDTQEEIDHYWENLSVGGEKQQCGWIKDKFGVSWQIVPNEMGRLMQAGDGEKTGRMMQAMMKMKKLDIAQLKAAYDGK